jgi:hypothetical protein
MFYAARRLLRQTLLVTLLIALSLTPRSMAYAADTHEAALSLPSVTAKAGDTVSLDVIIAGNPGIIGMTLEVNYDSRLTLTAIKNGSAFQALELTKPGVLRPGCHIHWDAVDLAESEVRDGVVTTLTFVLGEDVSAGTSCFVRVAGVSENGLVDVYDRSLNPVSLKAASGAVVVPKPVKELTIASPKSQTYTGEALTPAVDVRLNGRALTAGTDYTLTYTNNIGAGTATVVVKGKGAFTGSVSRKFTIAKAKNPLAAKGKTVSVGHSAVKKKAQALAASKVVTVSKAQGARTYRVAKWTTAKAKSYLRVDAKTGKVIVSKGTPKGTYTFNLQVRAAGNANYKAGTKTVVVKVVVK